MTIIAGLINKQEKCAFFASDKQSTMGYLKQSVVAGKVEQICGKLGTPLLYGTAGTAAHATVFARVLSLKVYEYLVQADVRFVPHGVLRHLLFMILSQDLKGSAEIQPILLNFDGTTHHILSSDALGSTGDNEPTAYATAGSGTYAALSILTNNYDTKMTEAESLELVKNSIAVASELSVGCGKGCIVWKIDSKGVVSMEHATNEDAIKSGSKLATRI
jgi:20S proteasome alpha/beta subunit